MPSLKQIKRRITGVTSTRQITRAMKLVAAAKLKRAQENMERARPYAWKLREVIASLAAHADAQLHPLLATHAEDKRIGIISVTSDRGMCGSFNINIARRTQAVLKEMQDQDVELITIGKNGNVFFKKREFPIFKYFAGVFQELDFSQAAGIGNTIVDLYKKEAFDKIYLVYNEFKNPVQQEIITEQLLPVQPYAEMTAWQPVEYIYEPDPHGVLDKLLPMHINIQIWRVLLESFAAEQAARMSAMDNATKNAEELVESLTLQYNKARQAVITTEILEIVGGAEGLK